jgi:hypothetical protein
MNFRHVISLVVLTAAMLTTAVWLARAPVDKSHSAKVAALFGGAEAIDTLLYAEKVEAYRIGPYHDARPKALADYPILAGPVPVPKREASDVAAALASPRSYVWDTAKGCAPSFGVRLSFIWRTERIDVLLCFKCNILLVYYNSREMGYEDFDPIRPILVQAARASFPDDPVIRSLK